MRQGFGSALVRAALALLIAAALSAAGWAHRLPTPDDSGDTGLALYLASGGSVADLCGIPNGTAVADEDCPVCRMPGALALPARLVPPEVLLFTVAAAASSVDCTPGSGRHPAWYGRAPPVV